MQPNNPYYPPNGNIPAPMPQTPANNGNHGLPRDSHVGFFVVIVLLSLIAIGLAVFAFWAFGQRQDYKDHSDQKVAVAVKAAEKATTEKNNLKFAEELKNPLKTYVGPEPYGSVSVSYPKTWSSYTLSLGGAGTPLDVYFHPDVIPSLQPAQGASTRQAIALHVQVVSQTYDLAAQQLKGQVLAGKATASPYALPNNPDQVGVKYVGTLQNQLQGTEIMVPLRDKTLIVTTETDAYLADFNNYVIPNLGFVP